MPDMVNQFGIIVNVLDEHVADNLTRGLRMAEESDYLITQSSRDAFRVGKIDRMEEGCLGCRPVQVIGNGPSRDAAKIRGAYRIIVNPRPDSPHADAALALDDVYWTMDWFTEWRAMNPAAKLFAPRGSTTDVPATRFTMPLHPANRTESTLNVRMAKAIKNCHFSGVAAMLVARYMTTGPVILQGFDLDGVDLNGVPYKRQTDGWSAVADVMRDEPVFRHQAMGGPLRFPVWLGAVINPRDWVVVAGGPSGADWMPPAGARPMIATCNAGIRRFANPDLYWLSDEKAGEEFGHLTSRAAHAVGRDKFNCEPFPYYPEDTTYHGRSSGIMALRAVLKLKEPRSVTLVGFDGWADNEMAYRRRGREYSRKGANEAMVDALRRVIDEHPDVDIRWAASTPLKGMVYGV